MRGGKLSLRASVGGTRGNGPWRATTPGDKSFIAFVFVSLGADITDGREMRKSLISCMNLT